MASVGLNQVSNELYLTAIAEFNSRVDVYSSFSHARGIKSWAKFYVESEVRQIASRDGIQSTAQEISNISIAISEDWFRQAATVLN